MGGPDTPENKEYIQKHKLWMLGELLTMKLIQDRPTSVEPFCAEVLKREQESPTTTIDPPTPDVAANAKAYLQENRIAFVIEDWLRSVLEEKPENPLDFSIKFFSKGSNVEPSQSRKQKVLILLYSTYGHCYAMAKAALEGATAAGAQAELMRIPETLPGDVLAKMGADAAAATMASIPVASVGDTALFDGLIFVFPTRFGTPPAQVSSFMDQTGGLWLSGALMGKPAGVIVSSATQHGGQESTILNFNKSLLHHGCILVGLPPDVWQGIEAMKGSGPYGPSTIAGGRGERNPSDSELQTSHVLGRRVAEVSNKLRSTL
eukprot:PhF_6_TR41481/c0_g1_i1/m.62881/K03809/wrbA; NAD(P)H dehydrogenase (quinone)